MFPAPYSTNIYRRMYCQYFNSLKLASRLLLLKLFSFNHLYCQSFLSNVQKFNIDCSFLWRFLYLLLIGLYARLLYVNMTHKERVGEESFCAT